MKKLFFLLLLPLLSNSQNPKQFPIDKQAHFLAGSTISAVTYSLVLKKTNNRKKAFWYSLTTPLILGVAKEVCDSQRKNNRFDNKDLGATVLGGLVVSVTLKFL